MSKRLLCVMIAAGAVACAHQDFIPGTTVANTEENNAVLTVVEQYRERMISKDVDGLLVLASDHYFEDSGGRSNTEYGYDRLREVLQQTFKRAVSIRYDLTYKKVEIKEDRADVEVLITGSFELTAPDGSNPYRRLNDYHRFTLQKNEKGKWKFLSGM